MAWNNPYAGIQSGGATFAPYTGVVPNYQTPPQQTQQQPSGTIMTVFVNSGSEVSGYPVAAGTTVLLLCFPEKKFWLKSTSTNGVPEALREFPFEEKVIAQTPQQSGVTREEFESLSSKIDKLISDLGGSNNG